MPRTAALTAILAALAMLAATGPSRGDEVAGPAAGPLSLRPPQAERGPAPTPHRIRHRRPAPALALPPEHRYRDPRYVAPIRRAPRFAAQPDFIHAYLPRFTELPMYNEPPTRFPAHW